MKFDTRVSACDAPLAAKLLADGELVALPTETVYGLAADAGNPTACAKIFEVKARPLSDPLIVHIPSLDWLDRLAEVPESAWPLAEKFWPGPLTLVLRRRSTVPDLVTAGQETVAIRMSAHPIFQEVIQNFGRPVAAPSANRFGRISPTTAAHVLEELGGRIPLIVDGGPCVHGIESTIVYVGDSPPAPPRNTGVPPVNDPAPLKLHILRQGPITSEQLATFGEVSGAVAGIAAPGNMASHYAPQTPLRIATSTANLREAFAELPSEPCLGLLAWETSGDGFAAVEQLSPSQDLREAAANLYAAMRRLDAAELDGIVAEPLPESGLGAAIMERLRRASAR